MNLISITIFLSFLNLVTPTPYQINDKEKTAIQYLARIYAMLINTFDPREVSEDFLILEQNQQEINDFSSVAIYLITRLETDDELSRVPKYLRLETFWSEVSSYNSHLHFDNKPMTFKLFKQMFHSVIQKGLIRPNEEYCVESGRQDLITEQQIREAIDRIDINDIDRTNTNLDKCLPGELFNHPDYYANEKSLTMHHIISRRIYSKFRIYSDAILANYRRELTQTIKYDYFKIRDHNRHKLIYPNIKQMFEKLNTKPRITHFEEDRYFKEFMRRIELIPNGLVFLGPSERSDDPVHFDKKDKQKRKEQIARYIERYGIFDEDFDHACKSIVGLDYYNRLIKLYEKIKKYIENANERTLDRTFEINDEIDNIHFYREDDSIYPWFEWHPHEDWNYDPKAEENKKWETKTLDEKNRPGTSGYIPTTTTFTSTTTSTTSKTTTTSTTSKTTTTEDVFAHLLDGMKIDDRFKYFRHDGLRRKRNQYLDPNLWIQNFVCPSKEITTTLKPTARSAAESEAPNGFWCSPFYLRINPIQYFYCKLTGHHNLHFF
jgi:hypothetical protein